MPPRKNKKGEKRKKNDAKQSPESSTPQSPTTSEDDDNENLLKGACGTSSDSRRSKSPNKTKGDDKKTCPSKYLGISTGTSSRNASQAGGTSETESLIVPEQKSPRKFSPKRIFEELVSKSPKRSSDSESSSSSKKGNQSECPALEKLAAKTRDKRMTSISSSDSKQSSFSESPVISKKRTEGPQSSSSADQSFSENMKASKSRRNDPSLLSVPAQESPRKRPYNENPPRSPSKSLGERRKAKTKPKAKSPNKIKSEGSSSSSSPSIPKKGKFIDEGNISSKSSPSSGFNDPDAVESSSSNEGNPSLEYSSGNTASRSLYDLDQEERVQRNRETFEKLLTPSSPSGKKRTKSLSHKTRHRLSSSEYDRYLSPSSDRIREELRRPLNANIPRVTNTEDTSEIERRLLQLTLTARPDTSVRRQQSRSPIRPRNCTCGQAARGTGHHVGCPFMIDLRARRKWRRCRQSVRMPRDSLEDFKKRDPASLGSKARYTRKKESKGQDPDSPDKKSDSEDDEKSS